MTTRNMAHTNTNRPMTMLTRTEYFSSDNALSSALCWSRFFFTSHPHAESGVRLPDRRRARIPLHHVERLMPGLIRDFQRIDAVRRGRRHEPCAHRMTGEV